MTLGVLGERAVDVQGTPDRRSSTMRAVVFSLVIAVGVSFVLNGSVWQALKPSWVMILAPLVDWRSIVVVWVFLLALAVTTRRFWTSSAFVLALAVLFAVITAMKFRFLGEPLMPSDVYYLQNPDFALSMVPWWTIPAACVAFAAALWCGHRADRGSTMMTGWGGSAWLRSGALVVVCVMIVLGVTFNRAGNPLRWFYDSTGQWSPISSGSNMLVAGYVGGFLAGMPMTAMEEPAGYGADEMRRVEATYTRLAAADNAGRDPGLRPNIVLVLAESVADPVGLDGVELSEDPLAEMREIGETAARGTTKAFAFGNGTSSMEYQALTGHAVSLFNPPAASPYHAFVSDHPDYPSLVSMAGDRGYRSVAIYPGDAGSYKRDTVFDALGFDQFADLDAMTHRDHLEDGLYVDDDSMFAEVESRIDQSAEPLFAHLLTMQNHSPFSGDTYADPVRVTGPEGKDEAMGQWARGLAHSSRALADLLERLERSPEPTVVVYYGDHFPPGFRTDVSSFGERSYETPFVVWSNFAGGQEGEDLGTVGPQYLAPAAFDRFGIVEPAMFALLTRLRDEVGTPTQRGIVDTQGRLIDPQDLSADQAALLRDYRLVQYDLSIGQRHARGMWTIPD